MIESEDSSGTARLREELAKYREQHTELVKCFDILNEKSKREKIESFEDLEKSKKKETKTVLVNLAQLTKPTPLEGINIGLFGLTSTGTSTIINSLFGQNVADTGFGETTTKITPYNGIIFTL
ncbi:unnamed protein product [Rotaria sp. Silwood1]|nr:unnamed protein product [Rotaria sp. Silwood1]CAF1624062.1 unnamed protein product [Rotaria sp. Silwood1]